MISVVVPVRNEQDNIVPLVEEIAAAAKSGVPVTEIVYIDDGSTDKTLEILKKTKAVHPMLKIMRHDHSCGQSAGLWTGIRAAANDVIVTLDGDGQNNPADIGLLYNLFQEASSIVPGGKVMVAGQREKRQDNMVRIISSRIANNIRSSFLQDGTRDTGCSLKLFRRQDYLMLPYFNHMHRYIPALMKRDGVVVKHVNVSHRPRTTGTSKYGTIDRLIAGLSDLLGVRWLLMRGRGPVTITEEK